MSMLFLAMTLIWITSRWRLRSDEQLKNKVNRLVAGSQERENPLRGILSMSCKARQVVNG